MLAASLTDTSLKQHIVAFRHESNEIWLEQLGAQNARSPHRKPVHGNLRQMAELRDGEFRIRFVEGDIQDENIIHDALWVQVRPHNSGYSLDNV